MEAFPRTNDAQLFPSGHVVLITETSRIAQKLQSVAKEAGLLRGTSTRGVVIDVHGHDDPSACLILGSSLDLEEQEQVFVLVEERRHLRSLRTVLSEYRYGWFFDLLAYGSWTSEFQPVIDLDQGGAYGYEALLRASLPDGTVIQPESIFRAARATRWLTVADAKSREAAIRCATKSPVNESRIFINLDPVAGAIDFAALADLLAEAERRPESVVFELVESDGLADAPGVGKFRDELGAAGFAVALDDLTSGFSTLTILDELRPEIAKLDRRLITGAHADRNCSRLVQAFVELCRDLEIVLIAEGIETNDDLEFVKRFGIRYAQGFMLGRPGYGS